MLFKVSLFKYNALKVKYDVLKQLLKDHLYEQFDEYINIKDENARLQEKMKKLKEENQKLKAENVELHEKKSVKK